jgi:transcriptional accessory protein Tex/SPT6
MTPDPARCIATLIAGEIGARAGQVAAAVDLPDGGATVPFVARDRKDATGGLDDTQLRTLSGRLVCLRDMDQRRMAILGSIRDQGKLTAQLEPALAGTVTKAELEDICLPCKVKRRTQTMIARENGLAPLAGAILAWTPPQSVRSSRRTICAGRAGRADPQAGRHPHLHRQWHRQPRDGKDGGRSAGLLPGPAPTPFPMR